MHRVWRVTDPAIHEAVADRLADAELLIADGHHRYETARAFMEEVGGEGPHRFTLMALTGLDDPGLTVFPTHRLISGLADDPERQQRLGNGLRELFEAEEVSVEALDPAGEEGIGVFGSYDSHHRRGFRLRLKDTAELDRLLAGKPEAYRHLDAVILETLVLKGILGMTEEDIAAKRGIGYAKSIPDSLARARPRAPTTSPSSSAPPRSSRSARSPARARRCRRSPPTSSPSCSRAWSSTRSTEPLRRGPGRCEPRIGWARGEDLHAQGRRRDDLALVRRPGAEVATAAPRPTARSTRRPRRWARRGPSAAPARRSWRATSSASRSGLFVAGAELATAPEAAERLEDGDQQGHRRDGRPSSRS